MSAAVTLVPQDQVGRGYGSADVLKAHLDKVGETLKRLDPELKARAIAAAKSLAKAKLELEECRVEIRRMAGDFVADAMMLIMREAETKLARELQTQREAKPGVSFDLGDVKSAVAAAEAAARGTTISATQPTISDSTARG